VGVTIRDVAKRAGVSVSTASLALNGKPLVSDETRQKVLKAAEELNYHPNAVAKSLADGRTRTLALFIPVTLEHLFSSAGFFGGLLKGMHRAALEQGYHISLHVVESEDEAAEQIRGLIRSGRSDGLIITNPTVQPPYLSELREVDLPVVFIGRPLDKNFPYVDNDNVEVGRLGVRHLIESGHERIVFLNGPSRFTFSLDRLEGYRRELVAAGLAYDEALVWSSSLTEEHAYTTVLSALEAGLEFTALFATSDIQAVGALRALREVGLAVPEDVAVLAVNNTALTRYYAPPIAAIDLHEAQLGYKSVQLLFQELHDRNKGTRPAPIEGTTRSATVPCTLVPRPSCGCSLH